jgi:hypothetical protein
MKYYILTKINGTVELNDIDIKEINKLWSDCGGNPPHRKKHYYDGNDQILAQFYLLCNNQNIKFIKL